MTIQNNWNELQISKDLLLLKQFIFDSFEFDCTQPQPEAESKEYSAYRFSFNKKNICYREAKITPTKTGQFVTLWKRNKSGIIEPFDFSDEIDFVIVSVRKETLLGQFIFPKNILLQKGIFSTETKEGIRATRVYPPWDVTTSKQAQKTQQWQLHYFYEISPNLDLKNFKNLIGVHSI
ncbi:MepB family protein [Flavobacterium sp. MR2016-29]|uniref:MepB family protein n=1 Tax=Flavobacterium sp. MR2016-29 TaxID=2783795 RepID=UPI00188CA5DF|nr:MepB family protein [Flavobacterium sp. MR2016-29]MBF4492674.1 MepB family protein [Flavobacterium sp. MR2016-29]